jgi:hypothetical protein
VSCDPTIGTGTTLVPAGQTSRLRLRATAREHRLNVVAVGTGMQMIHVALRNDHRWVLCASQTPQLFRIEAGRGGSALRINANGPVRITGIEMVPKDQAVRTKERGGA